jgi:hypothetical protein
MIAVSRLIQGQRGNEVLYEIVNSVPGEFVEVVSQPNATPVADRALNVVDRYLPKLAGYALGGSLPVVILRRIAQRQCNHVPEGVPKVVVHPFELKSLRALGEALTHRSVSLTLDSLRR